MSPCVVLGSTRGCFTYFQWLFTDFQLVIPRHVSYLYAKTCFANLTPQQLSSTFDGHRRGREVMSSFDSVYSVFVILIMIVSSLSAAMFLVWRFRTQGPLLIQVAPEPKVPPQVELFSAPAPPKVLPQVDLFSAPEPKVPIPPQVDLFSRMKFYTTSGIGALFYKKPKLCNSCITIELSEHQPRLYRPAPPSAEPLLPPCFPKLNQLDAVDPSRAKLRVMGSLWGVGALYPQLEGSRGHERGCYVTAWEPMLQPRHPPETMKAAVWPHRPTRTKLLQQNKPMKQPIDPSPSELIRKASQRCDFSFAPITLDGRGEPPEGVQPQRLRGFRIPRREVFITPNIGRVPRYMAYTPCLPRPTLPGWPPQIPKLCPKLQPSQGLTSELNTPVTPEPKPTPVKPKKLRQPKPVLPLLWPREGPWWTFPKADYGRWNTNCFVSQLVKISCPLMSIDVHWSQMSQLRDLQLVIFSTRWTYWSHGHQSVMEQLWSTRG